MKRFLMATATETVVNATVAAESADGRPVRPPRTHTRLTLDDVTSQDVTAVRAMRPITMRRVRKLFGTRGATISDARRLLGFLLRRGDITTLETRDREINPQYWPTPDQK